MPRINKVNGQPDKRARTSAANATKAHTALRSYIQKGKKLQEEEDEVEDVEEYEDIQDDADIQEDDLEEDFELDLDAFKEEEDNIHEKRYNSLLSEVNSMKEMMSSFKNTPQAPTPQQRRRSVNDIMADKLKASIMESFNGQF